MKLSQIGEISIIAADSIFMDPEQDLEAQALLGDRGEITILDLTAVIEFTNKGIEIITKAGMAKPRGGFAIVDTTPRSLKLIGVNPGHTAYPWFKDLTEALTALECVTV